MARTPFNAEWVQAGADICQWGRKAAYWKGKKGWWASRQNFEGIKGPFRTSGAAQKWAEEPFREQHRLAQQKIRDAAQQAVEARKTKLAAQKARTLALAQMREASDLVTWNGLPAEARLVKPGQIWAMKDPRFAEHQILVIEVKKTIAVVHARDSKATPWKGLAREPRTLSHLPRLYQLVGMAKVPAPSKSRIS
ncbi:MAG TPA: hypothetical protein VJ486_00595 [Geothrix sp.]|nr:hypothetical protein [Geothrix sp.]